MDLYLSSPICRHGVDKNRFNIFNVVGDAVLYYVRSGIYLLHHFHASFFSFSSTYFSSLRLFCKSFSSLFSFVFFSVRTLLFLVRFAHYARLSSPSFRSSSFPFLLMYVTIAITCYSMFSFSIPPSPSSRCCPNIGIKWYLIFLLPLC